MATNDRFGYTEDKTYELHFSSYYGDGRQIKEGGYGEMRDRAAKKIRYARKTHVVTCLNRGWEWEIEEDEDAAMVDPACGVLEIRCLTPVYDEEAEAYEHLLELYDDAELEQLEESY